MSDFTNVRWAALTLCFAAALTWTLQSAFGEGSAEKMRFADQPPSADPLLGNAWTIFADGPVDEDAAARLRALLKDKNVPRNSMLVLNSSGGSLMGGAELGRVIREFGLITDVGRSAGGQFVAGECYSACALAFLGGVFRYNSKASKYGFRRDDALSAALVGYVRDSGVDPDRLSEMTRAGSEEINLIPGGDLLRLGVINNGRANSSWTIEALGEGIYLKGARNSVSGIAKFILICNRDRSITLYAVFDPQGGEDEIVHMEAISLLIDGTPIPIAKHLSFGPKLVNGWINAQFSLNDKLRKAIEPAKSVGVIFQRAYGAPVFFGFDDLEVGDDGAKKLSGFLHTCRR